MREIASSSVAAARYSVPCNTTPHHTLSLTTTTIATHRASVHTYTHTRPLSHTLPSTPTRYTLHPPPTTPASTTTRPTPSPRPNPPPRPPPVCLAATAINSSTPCIARRRRASQSPVTCEPPALASSLRPSHNLAFRNGVKSMHAPPSAARRSHWHSAPCDCATLAPNKPRHPLTVIHRSSSGNISSW